MPSIPITGASSGIEQLAQASERQLEANARLVMRGGNLPGQTTAGYVTWAW
ncbi:hypothetical protein [Nonomuraea deserti]|uniref:hypothetical protein n=1 Tax=Nonomuraea deserti TaxID=1848322 RepID=UPI001404EA76|nr:hypothetical protein [Nonomuraea deserti]